MQIPLRDQRRISLVPKRQNTHPRDGAARLTTPKRRPGILCLPAAQNASIAALQGGLELVRMGTADGQPAASASRDDACAPRVDVRLHVHLMEDRVGPHGPLAALVGGVQAFRNAEDLRREREEFLQARRRPGPRGPMRIMAASDAMWHVKYAA